MAMGDAYGVRYEHAIELFRVKGGGRMGDLKGLPESRLAILPGTTHVGMMKRRQRFSQRVKAAISSFTKIISSRICAGEKLNCRPAASYNSGKVFVPPKLKAFV